MKTASFGQLFRRSRWATFDPSIPRIYEPIKAATSGISGKPAQYNLKQDLPANLFGKPCGPLFVSNLDGTFGLPHAFQADDYQKRIELMAEIRDRPRVPARVLGRRREGGWWVGVAGMVASLPAEECPSMFSFTPSDIIEKRAYWMRVVSAEFDSKGHPNITLSLKRQ